VSKVDPVAELLVFAVVHLGLEVEFPELVVEFLELAVEFLELVAFQ